MQKKKRVSGGAYWAENIFVKNMLENGNKQCRNQKTSSEYGEYKARANASVLK